MELITHKLPSDIKQKWVYALRSGKYNQAKGFLFDPGQNNGYCCLGVLGSICGYDDKELGMNRILPTEWNVPEILRGRGADNDIVYKLTGMNDEGNKSFAEIADWIEKNL